MYRKISLPKYLEWRDRTQGGIGTKEVHYTLKSLTDENVELTGIIPVTSAHEDKCRVGMYSSVIFAALDSTNFNKMLPEPRPLKVLGEKAVSYAKAPTFIVTGIDLDEENKGACIKVYVEGRI